MPVNGEGDDGERPIGAGGAFEEVTGVFSGVLVVDEFFAVIGEGIINGFDVDVQSGLNIFSRAIGNGVGGLRYGPVVVRSRFKLEGTV